jgi:hypothetical protein
VSSYLILSQTKQDWGDAMKKDLPPRHIPTRPTAERYFVVPRTITRWRQNPELGFPQPRRINGRWYYDVAELDAFDRRQADKDVS